MTEKIGPWEVGDFPLDIGLLAIHDENARIEGGTRLLVCSLFAGSGLRRLRSSQDRISGPDSADSERRSVLMHTNRSGAARFQVGHEPWNKGLSGIHLSPASEFKLGQKPVNHLPVGSATVRLDKVSKRPRRWVKTEEPNKWRPGAVVVWEAINGSVPSGVIIHHRDGDATNDTLDNLEPVTRSEHLAIHLPEFEAKMRMRCRVASVARWARYRAEHELLGEVRPDTAKPNQQIGLLAGLEEKK
jgi:hypothetical protein